jgi:hypothetical protein
MSSFTQDRLAVVLSELSKLYPQWRYGQLVLNVATWARGPSAEAIWDVTDEELLQAAQAHLQNNPSKKVG